MLSYLSNSFNEITVPFQFNLHFFLIVIGLIGFINVYFDRCGRGIVYISVIFPTTICIVLSYSKAIASFDFNDRLCNTLVTSKDGGDSMPFASTHGFDYSILIFSLIYLYFEYKI